MYEKEGIIFLPAFFIQTQIMSVVDGEYKETCLKQVGCAIANKRTVHLSRVIEDIFMSISMEP